MHCRTPSAGPTARRIAITSDHLAAGGAERSAANAAALLSDLGYQTYLLTATEKPDYFDIDSRVHRVRLANYHDVFDFLRDNAIPIAFHYGYWNAELAELIGCDADRADVMCFRSSYFRSLSDPSPRNFLLVHEHWARAAAITTLTRSTQFVLSRFLDAVFLVPNFYAAPIAQSAPLAGDRILAFTSAERVHIKRPDRALRVFRKVLDVCPHARLTFVGSYDLGAKIPARNQTLSELQTELGLGDGHVEWVGQQSDVDRYYQRSSLLLQTSVTEGFPNVLLEAAAHGVPRICFRFPGVEDMLRDGIDGFILEQGDLDGMADRVHHLLSDSAVRRGMGTAAQEIPRFFNRDRVRQSWEALLAALDTRNPASIAYAAQQQLEGFSPEYSHLLGDYDHYMVQMVRRVVECEDARKDLAEHIASANEERRRLREQVSMFEEERRSLKYLYEEATKDFWFRFGKLNWKGKLWHLLRNGLRR